jgi:pyruvate/2-oxoglutarate dehydrogenase complex dihydrolipoamide acyltransferase (E2) component
MIEITIPKLGLTMESAKVVRWEFQSGEEVKEGDNILVIETDKVTFEVPSPATGILHPIATPGTTCAVEETVGFIAANREEYETLLQKHPSSSADEAEWAEAEEARAEPAPPAASPAPAGGRVKASPLARSMAGAHNLNLAAMRGSGPGGRIVRADILRALEETPRPKEARGEEKAAYPDQGKDTLESIPITGVRRVIFENMHQSLTQSAQLTLHTEASAEALSALRNRLTRDGQKVSFNAILIKIAAMALRRHPKMNASVEGDTIQVWRQVHIGLAMEANDALIVPVVRSPDRKTIREIDEEVSALVSKTRENRLSLDDLANGTFTITNLGFADIDFFTPIIRPPESAILGVGRLVRKPVIHQDQVVPQVRMGLSLTFDHRIIDGAPAARFLKTVREMVEEPVLMIG